MTPLSSLPRAGVALALLSAVFGLVTGCSGRTQLTRLLERADGDYQASRYDQAEIEYKNVLQADAQNATAITRLGLIFHEQGRDARALAFLAKAKELQPAALDARLQFGLASLATGNVKDARAEAIYLLERLPQDERVALLLVEASSAAEFADTSQRLLGGGADKTAPRFVGLGQLALRQNHGAEAEEYFRAALLADPKSPGAHGGLAMRYWSQQKLADADAEFGRAADGAPARSPRRLRQAQFKLQTGDLAGGRQLLVALSQEAPDYLPVWVWLAELAAMEKKFPEAEAFLQRALARDPLHAEALMLGARIRLAKGETDKGISELERLLTLFPQSAPVNYQLGLAHVTKGEPGKALLRFAQAAPEMPVAMLAMGEVHLRARDFAAAIAVLRPLVQQHPELVNARLVLAEALRSNGDLAEAAALYDRLETELPRDPRLAYSRGLLALQQKRPDDARRAFQHVAELAPGHLGAAERLVELDLADRHYDAARTRLAVDLRAAPQSAPLHLLLAQVCLAQKDTAAAEAALLRALDLQPDSPRANFQLARLYLDSAEPAKALAKLQATVAHGPPNLPALLLLGILHDERQEYPAAREAYERALVIDPKNTLALNNLAYLCADRFDQLDQALGLAQRARALLPQDPRTADTLGWILVKKKQYAPAVALLQESAARLPEEFEVQYHLGTASYLLGDEAPARAAFERALTAPNSAPWKADAQRQLAVLKLDPRNSDRAARAGLEKQLKQNPADPVIHLRLAAASERDGEPANALLHYRAVLETNSRHLPALLGAARTSLATSDTPKALEWAKAARALAPADPIVAHLLGRVAFAAGDQRWAANVLGEAARLRPDDPEILYDRAMADYSLGRVADAESGMRAALDAGGDFSRAAEARELLALLSLAASPPRVPADIAALELRAKANSASVPLLMALGAVRDQEHNAEDARRIYERVLVRYPDFAPAQKQLTLLSAASAPDDRKAGALAMKARQAFPNDPAVARAGGMIAYREGDFARAANLLSETAGKSSTDGEVMYYLGMAQARLNQRPASRLSLQRALDLGVKESLAAEAKKHLAARE